MSKMWYEIKMQETFLKRQEETRYSLHEQRDIRCIRFVLSVVPYVLIILSWSIEAMFTYLSSLVWQFSAAASLLRISSTFPYGSPLPSEVLTDRIPTEPGLTQSGIDLPFVPSQYRMPFSSKSCM